VPTGIRPDVFAPGDRAAARRELGLPESGLYVGLVATLRSWKGHRHIIDAFARLGRDADLSARYGRLLHAMELTTSTLASGDAAGAKR
jgi:glycosyltransferase involved in cell wall biosynthesis